MKIALEYGKDFDIKRQTEYAVKGITKICNKIGPRKPGSLEEHRAQQWFQRDMKNYCEDTKIEEFTLHRQGFMGFIPFTVACGIASVFVNWFASPIAAFILCILAFIPLVFEFLMYKQFDDFLYRRSSGKAFCRDSCCCRPCGRYDLCSRLHNRGQRRGGNEH